MKISRGKFVHLKLPCLFAFFMFVLIYMAGSLYWVFTENFLAQPSFIETNKCPVCYGESLCKKFQNNNIELSALKNMGFLNILNSNEKNVQYATIGGEGGAQTEIVLKKLGRNRDLSDLDARICSESKMAANCDVSSAILKLAFIKSSVEDTAFAKHLLGTSTMFYCPSTRLISELFTKYKERSVSGSLTTRDKIQIWSTAAVNQEPLLLQMFPASSGWPFPAYLGACGRYVAVAYSGKPLSQFYDVDWKTRADLAYQLMKIADVMTNNKEDFALYLTDVNDDNFVVDDSWKVTVIDLEDVLVVDKMAVKSARPQGWDDVHESVYIDCPGQSFKYCHSFSEIQLCSHVTSDHNYYVMCRYILTRHYDDTGTGQSQVDGLLHDIPEVAIEDWDLEYLLNECVSPKRQRGRIQVVHKLIEALENTRKL